MKITLCGSTKFKKDYRIANRDLTYAEHIVYSVSLFGHADKIELTEEQKKILDRVHKRKILESDAILVINKNNYIGESTASEIEFAIICNKKIVYMFEKDTSIYTKTKWRYTDEYSILAFGDDLHQKCKKV